MNTQASDNPRGAARRPRTARATGATGWWSRIIAPPAGSARHRAVTALETVVLTLVAIAACRALSHDDPLLVGSGFGWIWLVPVLVALRYGSAAGVLSGLLLLAAWHVLYAAAPPAVGALGALGALAPTRRFPLGFFFGGFFLTLLAGQFGDIWLNRLRQSRIANDYLAERLAILTREQFMLRLSHERLEQDLLSRPATLRDALARLRTLVLAQEPSDAEQGEVALRGAQAFLEAAAQATQLEVASVHAWRAGAPASEAAASIGRPAPLDPRDPLLREALEARTLVHVAGAAEQVAAASRYLACVPLVDARGEMAGVVAIERMPFLALTRDNLQFLLVLCHFYADGVRHATVTRDMLAAFPACPHGFALDYARLVHLRRATHVESSIVMLVFDSDARSTAWYEHVLRMRRSLDAQWSLDGHGRRAILTLMPLSSGGAVEGYLLRIENSLQAQFGVTFETAHVAVYSMRVPVDEPIAVLHDLLERSGVGA